MQFGDVKLGQGMDGAKKFLKENPKTVEQIKKAIVESSEKPIKEK
jgi:hypothetical protein